MPLLRIVSKIVIYRWFSPYLIIIIWAQKITNQEKYQQAVVVKVIAFKNSLILSTCVDLQQNCELWTCVSHQKNWIICMKLLYKIYVIRFCELNIEHRYLVHLTSIYIYTIVNDARIPNGKKTTFLVVDQVHSILISVTERQVVQILVKRINLAFDCDRNWRRMIGLRKRGFHWNAHRIFVQLPFQLCWMK